MVKIKKPRFSYNEDFSCASFNESFDYILAHSIFTHTGVDILKTSFKNFREAINKTDGVVVATFFHGDKVNNDGRLYSGWIYPGCTHFDHEVILSLFEETGFHGALLPWFHPAGQRWYLATVDKNKLPDSRQLEDLKGTMLLSEFGASTHTPPDSELNRFLRIFGWRP